MANAARAPALGALGLAERKVVCNEDAKRLHRPNDLVGSLIETNPELPKFCRAPALGATKVSHQGAEIFIAPLLRRLEVSEELGRVNLEEPPQFTTIWRPHDLPECVYAARLVHACGIDPHVQAGRTSLREPVVYTIAKVLGEISPIPSDFIQGKQSPLIVDAVACQVFTPVPALERKCDGAKQRADDLKHARTLPRPPVQTSNTAVIAEREYGAVRTSDQQTDGPDDATRALTRRLADLAKRDGARFAAVVRAADAAQAAGAPRDEAYRMALETVVR